MAARRIFSREFKLEAVKLVRERGVTEAQASRDLGVSRSGFYAWLNRPRCKRSLDDEVIGNQVRQSFLGSDRTYGARRVWHDVLALGQRCGLHRIERLMRVHTPTDLAAVAFALNTRPRKTLGWRTPAEAFDKLLRSVNRGYVATTG